MIAKKTIEAKFRRAGIKPTKTYLWVDMAEDLKREVQKEIQLQENEYCIICFYNFLNHFLVLTTNRIVIMDDGGVESYLYTSIDDVRLNEVFNGQQSKENNDTINLILKTGEKVNIKVENKTWHTLFSIIRLITVQDGITL